VQIVNIHEAKTHLSRLIAAAEQGEPFVIAKAGKPVVLVTAIVDETKEPASRLGFMKGEFHVPDDFDRMGGDAIEQLFAGVGR